MELIIKSSEDILKIQKACDIYKELRAELTPLVIPGVSVAALDLKADEIIRRHGAIPCFYQYEGFPGHICISVNSCVIHGVPNDYVLKDNDIVTFDCGVEYEGHICDSAFTIIVGQASEDRKEILAVTQKAVDVAEAIMRPGVTNMEVARAIEKYVTSTGYKLLHDFTGHSCGNSIHEDPAMPNYFDHYFEEVALQENMVLCIEPMVMTGSNKYAIDPFNGWSVYARNGEITCHCEDEFLITKDGCIRLTKANN